MRVGPCVLVWYLVPLECAPEFPRTSAMGGGQGRWIAEPSLEGPSSIKDVDGDVVR